MSIAFIGPGRRGTQAVVTDPTPIAASPFVTTNEY
jgi:hypothetical protein